MNSVGISCISFSSLLFISLKYLLRRNKIVIYYYRGNSLAIKVLSKMGFKSIYQVDKLIDSADLLFRFYDEKGRFSQVHTEELADLLVTEYINSNFKKIEDCTLYQRWCYRIYYYYYYDSVKGDIFFLEVIKNLKIEVDVVYLNSYQNFRENISTYYLKNKRVKVYGIENELTGAVYNLILVTFKLSLSFLGIFRSSKFRNFKYSVEQCWTGPERNDLYWNDKEKVASYNEILNYGTSVNSLRDNYIQIGLFPSKGKWSPKVGIFIKYVNALIFLIKNSLNLKMIGQSSILFRAAYEISFWSSFFHDFQVQVNTSHTGFWGKKHLIHTIALELNGGRNIRFLNSFLSRDFFQFSQEFHLIMVQGEVESSHRTFLKELSCAKLVTGNPFVHSYEHNLRGKSFKIALLDSSVGISLNKEFYRDALTLLDINPNIVLVIKSKDMNERTLAKIGSSIKEKIDKKRIEFLSNNETVSSALKDVDFSICLCVTSAAIESLASNRRTIFLVKDSYDYRSLVKHGLEKYFAYTFSEARERLENFYNNNSIEDLKFEEIKPFVDCTSEEALKKIQWIYKKASSNLTNTEIEKIYNSTFQCESLDEIYI